jgi:transcriptional regulator GlxA family with amidase domain
LKPPANRRDELAAICSVTPIQFARKFFAHYGMRPHAFVLKQKVERTCQHPRKDNLELKEIALLGGFADQSHVNRVFRKYQIARLGNIAVMSQRADQCLRIFKRRFAWH